ncbi:SDR family NAD(P)-dependent oxidoreductase [Pleomorphomonas carboxyditropha]|uniref:Ketoreductase domain-containing protein n=1 Tax=Pleomorphomonas carboxyditropha TaxID=2023338 RepID=A0A2G9WZ79_9HYPH|nr:SDR family NAD(P)-dependent oxidoreductase [Pleomorphomonas carboxyditropha]PIP00039.1 hypothetical protein CJ014_04655 [Pleomorphomonas carboxyditropha]
MPVSETFFPGRFAGKRALVTGGAGGMGRAVSRRLAREGADVVIVDIDAEAGSRLAGELSAAGGRASFAAADVSDAAAVASAIDGAGPLDVLITVAGGSAPGLVADLEPAEWERLFRLNVVSTAAAVRAALPGMRRRGGGAIVTMASISGTAGDPGWGAYNAAKAAIINLTQTLAWEEGRHGIRANAVAPGPIASPRMIATIDDAEQRAYRRHSALGRLGAPEEAAAAILFLASDDAAFVTGATLVVDGGLTARTGQPLAFDATLEHLS